MRLRRKPHPGLFQDKAEFPDSGIMQAWLRSGGKCECTRAYCGHGSRCSNVLVLSARGETNYCGWQANLKAAKGPAVLENCEIICWQCYQNATTYGY